MSKKEKSAVYNILAFTFQGEKTAGDTVKEIKKSGTLDGQMIVAEAIVSVDEKGKAHIHESGHGVAGGTIGLVAGGLLGLIGGPAGLLAWTVGGAVVGGVAGKYLGRPFSKGDLKEIGEVMDPDTSAFLLIVEDIQSEVVIDKMEGFNANVITLTVGDDMSGQIASYVAGEAHDDQGNVIAGEGIVAADAEGNVAAAGEIAGAAIDEEGNVVVADEVVTAAADAEGDVVVTDDVVAATNVDVEEDEA